MSAGGKERNGGTRLQVTLQRRKLLGITIGHAVRYWKDDAGFSRMGGITFSL
jgi:hypothetical protein